MKKKTKPYFLRKIKVEKLKCRLLQFLYGALRVNNAEEKYLHVLFIHIAQNSG